ncbi:hypothetical protein PFISCL1PPCAC_1063, partial [Pristionchus fissidentatus]
LSVASSLLFYVMYSKIIAVLLIVGVCADWSDWTETSDFACSATCGMCGVKVAATRTCTGNCSGAPVRYEECGAGTCFFPNPSCCAGYEKKVFGGQIQCAAKAGAVAPK